MRVNPILLAVIAVLVVSLLLAGAPGTVAANGDHDHGDEDDDGGLSDWVPDFVDDFVRAISGLFGSIGASDGTATVGGASG